MNPKKRLKDSYSLYGDSPVYWMFLPYYVATSAKKEKAKSEIAKMLEKQMVDVDSYKLSTLVNARDFNEELLSEMDADAKKKGIKTEDVIKDLMDACSSVLEKHGLDEYFAATGGADGDC